jgi:murein DD-endopeptidase MepM/ murein hydrolase activator NlpD
MAAGNGTVVFEGVASGYGNFIKVNHGNGYLTAYGHLSRFAPGVRNGSRVRQGQVIAYSGMTGVATGPHLHYEIYQNGGQVNPAKVKFAEGRKLAGNELRNYLVERLHIDAKMASMKLETRVADLSVDLRQAKATK